MPPTYLNSLTAGGWPVRRKSTLIVATSAGHDLHEFGRCFEEGGESLAGRVDVEASPQLGLLVAMPAGQLFELHPKFSWYGPSGIGTARGIPGFRHNHQIPFLNALPDRVGGSGRSHFFAEGNYVGVTGWPNMSMTVSGDGWLGIAPANTPITMRSLDFWRVENGLIRENWVLVDLLHVWDQLGVDVLARMRELVTGPSYTF